MTEERSAQPGRSADVSRLVGRLDNADVRWNGTFYGPMPTVASNAGRRLLDAGAEAIPHLIGALGDASRFVAAHVLLTLLSGVEYPTAPWNGLEIELTENAEPRIDPGQRSGLARRWRSWQAQSPHPRALPPDQG